MNAKAEAIIKAARQEAANVETWADLSNFLFDPDYGIVAKAFQTEAERKQFIQSAEYMEIRKLIAEVRERTGVIEGATPKRLSKVEVRMPLPLQASLKMEAVRAGVSLNQLVVEKLTMHTPSPFTAK